MGIPNGGCTDFALVIVHKDSSILGQTSEVPLNVLDYVFLVDGLEVNTSNLDTCPVFISSGHLALQYFDWYRGAVCHRLDLGSAEFYL